VVLGVRLALPNALPHCMAFFYVLSCDEAVAKNKELGGKELLAPMTIEKVGRMDILADPRGAVFAGIGREGSAHPS